MQDDKITNPIEPSGDSSSVASPLRIRKIVVPVDFSPCSRKALGYAISFARQFGAEIMLLHVLQLNPLIGSDFTEMDFPGLEQAARDAGNQQLDALTAEEKAEGVKVQSHLLNGRAWEEIVEFSAREAADLIIISTHGHTGLKHVLLGSIAENVVRHAHCPVLVVRERERDFVD